MIKPKAAGLCQSLRESRLKIPFLHPPGDAGGIFHTLALPSANGLSWVNFHVTGLTKILLLCVQSQNPAPGDI